MDQQFRAARVWSNNELRRIGRLFCGSVVNVSAGENLDKEGGTYQDYFPDCVSFSLTNYSPGAFRGFQGRDNEYLLDLTGEVPLDLLSRFDVVFNHTVLEHVFDVRHAFRTLCQLSKDIVIVVVPFAQVQHDSSGYLDYWRLCPSGVRALYNENGLEVIYEARNDDVNSAVYLLFVGSRCPENWKGRLPSFEPITDAGDWIGREKTKPRKPGGLFEPMKRLALRVHHRLGRWRK